VLLPEAVKIIIPFYVLREQSLNLEIARLKTTLVHNCVDDWFLAENWKIAETNIAGGNQ